jgi:hypothetical protein
MLHGGRGLTVARSKFKRNGDKCDGGTFLRLPNVVLKSPGYRMLSHPARALLIDIAMQYSGHNNGKLTACAKYLRPLGWKSNDTIVRARRELIDCALLLETRKGARPNKAAWFALTWLDIDQGQGLDIDPGLYRRGAYMRPDRPATDGASLVPAGGVAKGSIAPARGARASAATPAGGAIRPLLTPSSTPAGGAYLEIPSAPASTGGVGSGLAVSPTSMAALKRTAGAAH